jgi:hypothetical protein
MAFALRCFHKRLFGIERHGNRRTAVQFVRDFFEF